MPRQETFDKCNMHFAIHDLDLDPISLILILGLDMVKRYHHTKNEVSM